MSDLKPAATRDTRQPLWTPALIFIFFTDVVIFSSAQLLRPVISLYVADMGANKTMVGIVASAFIFTGVLFRPLSGLVMDNFGRKAVLITGIALFALVGAVLPLGLALSALIGVRVLQGLAWSAVPPANDTIVSELVPASRRGEGLGYSSTIRNIGVALGPAMGLYLADTSGYPMAFGFSTILAFAALGAAFKVESPYVPPAGSKSWSLNRLVEPRALAPALVSALMNVVVSGMVTFVPLDAKERNIGSAIVFFLVISAMLMVIRPLMGGVSDRLPRRGALLIPGLVVVALSALTLAFTEAVWTLPLAAVFWAIGFGTAQPAIRAMILDRVPRDRWGSANATNLVLYDLGHAVGPFVLGLIAARFSLAATFGFSALSPLVAIVLIFFTGLHREEPRRHGGD
jgi:MFS family permease